MGSTAAALLKDIAPNRRVHASKNDSTLSQLGVLAMPVVLAVVLATSHKVMNTIRSLYWSWQVVKAKRFSASGVLPDIEGP